MTIGRRWSVAAVVLPLLVLGACSQDPEPTFSPPSETPSAAESTETSAAPAPEPWEEKSVKGAVAFAEHWIESFNQAQVSGRTEVVRSLSRESCGTCDAVLTQIERLYGDGGHLESGEWTVEKAVPAPEVPIGRSRVVLRISQAAQVVHHGEGDSQHFDRARLTLSARLAWHDGRWLMSDLIGMA